MPDFLTDEEMTALEGSNTPDFIPDSQAPASEPTAPPATPAGPTGPFAPIQKRVRTQSDFSAGVKDAVLAPGRTIQGLLSKGADKLLGSKGFGAPTAPKAPEDQTGAYKTGQFAGEVATFAAPGGVAAKAVAKAPFLVKTGVTAATDALTQALSSGEVDAQTRDAAIAGAIFPGASKLLGKAGGLIPSGKEAAAKVVNSLIKPLLKDFSYGKNPGRAVAEEGITGNSFDELAEKIGARQNEVGQQISERIAQMPQTALDMVGALSPLDEALEKAQRNPRVNKTVIGRLNDLKADLLRVTTDADGNEIVGRDLSLLSPQEIFELKKEVGELTRWTGEKSDDQIVNAALQRVYRELKNKLNRAVPGLDELNERYADLTSARIATEYRDKIVSRQNLVSFTGTQAGLISALATALTAGGAVLPIIVGAGAAGLTEAAKSPAVKSRLAAWLASASASERTQLYRQAPWARATLQSILFGEDEPSQPVQDQ